MRTGDLVGKIKVRENNGNKLRERKNHSLNAHREK
jgi:hypothetical protein